MEKGSSLIKNIDSEKTNNYFSTSQFLILFILVIIAGGIIGFVSSKIIKKQVLNQSQTINVKKTGIVDKKTFKDKAEGVLKEGGIDGEGNFHLERPGGVSQNVYLTSSTVDLSQFIGKKVRVWGETFAAEKAGWLMDVGFVEIIKE